MARKKRRTKKNLNGIGGNMARVKSRLNIMRVLFVLALVALVGRIGYFKVVKGEEFEREVLERMSGTESELDALRGNIVDRNSRTIATSTIVYNIVLDPKRLLEQEEAEKQKTYKALAEYSGKSVADITKLITDNGELQYKIFMKHISAEDMESLNKQRLKGVWYEETFERKYPKNELAAQTIGFYNNENGQYGIEQAYDEYMKGKPGRIFPKLQDGNIVTTEIASATNGSMVVLTIDEVIQQYVEQTMTKYIKQTTPLNAAALVMNPKTGEVYAMYSYPHFNPNKYTNLSDQVGKSYWDSLKGEDQTKLLNKAWQNFNIQHAYEPGSTVKPLIVSAALEEGYVDESFQFNCIGHATVADRRIGCWKTSGHGLQTLEQVLANSCNPGIIAITQNMPKEKFDEYLKKYGFGELTGIDLPGEAKGQLHNVNKLGPVEKATNSMGQNFTATTIQVLTGFSAVINGGYLMQPYVVSQVVDPDNNVVYEKVPEVKRQVISNITSAQMTAYMEKVITGGGTGVSAAIPGYRMGGKTGTAEKQPREEGKEIISFIGYAPIEDPEVVTLVLFDEASEGVGVPANTYKEIMENVLPYLGISTDMNAEAPTISMAVVPDVTNTNLYTSIERLVTEELIYETIGVGTKVTGQYPVPGTKMPKGGTVKIYLETDQPNNIVVVPDLAGLTLEEAGVVVDGLFKLKPSGSGKIISQVPKVGTKIEKDKEIIVQTIQ
ncbi:MAG: penicillin-binding transpeptidase domain-containing protein [Cellulosilyticaceae bacterium]